MRVFAICSPCDYFGVHMQKQIAANRKANPWIFDIIKNEHSIEPLQNCVIKRPDWTLVMHSVKTCAQNRNGSMCKYLIVFHDENLQSLRSLRGCHIPLLKEIWTVVCHSMRTQPARFGLSKKPESLYIYFHYWPSVFQLHAHVVLHNSHRSSSRCHEFKNVIHNLMRDDKWYSKALIMTPYNRTIQRQEGAHAIENLTDDFAKD